MSNSIRFLGLAVVAWAGVRAISLGLVPGTQAFAFDIQGRQPPPLLPAVQPTALPPIEPVAPPAPPTAGGMSYGAYPAYPPHAGYQGYPGYVPHPVYIPVPAAAPRSSPPQVYYLGQAPAAPLPHHDHPEAPTAANRPGNLPWPNPFRGSRRPPASAKRRSLRPSTGCS